MQSKVATILLAAGSVAALGERNAPTAHGVGAMGTEMGPVGFLWPADRPWSAGADNTEPCGSTQGVGNRTPFPLCMLISLWSVSSIAKTLINWLTLSIFYSRWCRLPLHRRGCLRCRVYHVLCQRSVSWLCFLVVMPHTPTLNNQQIPRATATLPSRRSRRRSARSYRATSATSSTPRRAPSRPATMPPSSSSTGPSSRARTMATTRPFMPAPTL